MNINVKKIYLDHKTALEYFLDHINWGNSLSDNVLEQVDFSKGSFFTILPNNANFDNIEDFKHGGILPPIAPRIKLPSGGGYLEEVPTTRVSLSNIIYEFLQQDDINFCIGEDVIRGPTDKSFKKLNINFLLMREEIYYLLGKESSIQEIEDVVCLTNALYHMLIVLTKGQFEFKEFLNQENLVLICQGAKYIIGSAYDGESYIIWESKP